jgi:hypothetical protein
VNSLRISVRPYPAFLGSAGACAKCILAIKRISVMRNDGVVAAKPKSTVTFYVNGVARFTFFRREDRFDCSNELIGG